MNQHHRRDPGRTPLIPGAIYELSPQGALLRDDPSSAEHAVVPPGSGEWMQVRLVEGLEVIPGYRLKARIGEGGDGKAAIWEVLGPGDFPMAMEFHPLDGDAAGEIPAVPLLRTLRHPNILTLSGFWELDGVFVVGMELADGSVLDHSRKALDRGEPGLPAAELAKFLGDAARGLDYLNSATHTLPGRAGVGLLHGDIKPENLLMVGGSVKIGDLGRIRPIDEATPGGVPAGADAPHLAPELARGRPSRRSDQYSLAATYCQLRGGRMPRRAGSPREPGRDPREEPDLTMLPEAERPAIARALSEDPADRWPDCSTFVAELIGAARPRDRGPAEMPRAAFGPYPGPPDRSAGAARGRLRPAPIVLMILPLLAFGLIYPRSGPAPGVTASRGTPTAPRRATPDRGPATGPTPRVEAKARPGPEGLAIASRDTPGIADATPSAPARPDDAGPDARRVGIDLVVLLKGRAEAARGRIGRAADRFRSMLAPLLVEEPRDALAPIPAGDSLPGAPAERPEALDPEALVARLEVDAPPVAAVADPAAGLPALSPSPAPAPPAAGDGPRGEPEKAAAGAAARVVERPRTATIVVWMPDAKAELVVRGNVGRGNPDEWYGPKRVIHTPPIAQAKDYLVGAFWVGAAGKPMTRTKDLSVRPGRSYVVDLRPNEPTSTEGKK